MVDDKYKWLYDDINGLKEKIIFRDKIEYRVNGLLHNINGPALILKFDPLNLITPSPDNEKYYIRGNPLSFEDWSIFHRKAKLRKIKKSIDKNKDH